jgi:hypothetical protein
MLEVREMLEPAAAREAHLDAATGPRLCLKDQPQHAREPKGSEMIPARTPPAEPLRLVIPHTTAFRFPALFVGPVQRVRCRGQGEPIG